MLLKMTDDKELIARVCYLVGHHHTYTDIDGLDYQILVEADYIVNMYEIEADSVMVNSVYRRIFRTELPAEKSAKWFLHFFDAEASGA